MLIASILLPELLPNAGIAETAVRTATGAGTLPSTPRLLGCDSKARFAAQCKLESSHRAFSNRTYVPGDDQKVFSYIFRQFGNEQFIRCFP
jgi:hypothetical protein